MRVACTRRIGTKWHFHAVVLIIHQIRSFITIVTISTNTQGSGWLQINAAPRTDTGRFVPKSYAISCPYPAALDLLLSSFWKIHQHPHHEDNSPANRQHCTRDSVEPTTACPPTYKVRPRVALLPKCTPLIVLWMQIILPNK